MSKLKLNAQMRLDNLLWVSRTQVRLLYNRFNEGREYVSDESRRGRPNTSRTHENLEAIKKMILDHRWIAITEIADDVGMLFGSCEAIFVDV